MKHIPEEINKISTIHYENIALFEMRYDFFREYLASLGKCSIDTMSKKENIRHFCQYHSTHYASINKCINDLFGTCSLKDADHIALHKAFRMCIAAPVEENKSILMETVLQTLITLINSSKPFRSHILFVDISYKKEYSEAIAKRTKALQDMNKPNLLPISTQVEEGLTHIQATLYEIYTRLEEQIARQSPDSLTNNKYK